MCVCAPVGSFEMSPHLPDAMVIPPCSVASGNFETYTHPFAYVSVLICIGAVCAHWRTKVPNTENVAAARITRTRSAFDWTAIATQSIRRQGR